MQFLHMWALALSLLGGSSALSSCLLVPVDMMEKVPGSGPLPPLLEGPIVGARGETVQFQVMMAAPPDGIQNATLAFSSDLPGLDGNIRLVELVYVNNTANPNIPAGWFPDPLLPIRNALTLAPSASRSRRENWAFWISATVPSSAPAGLFEMTVQLNSSSGSCEPASVRIRVIDFAMPERLTQVTGAQFGLKSIDAYAPGASDADMIKTAELHFKSLARAGVNSLVWFDIDALPFAVTGEFTDKSLATMVLNTTRFDAVWPRIIEEIKPIGFKLPLTSRFNSKSHYVGVDTNHTFSTREGPVSVPVFTGNGTINPVFAAAYTKVIQASVAYLESQGWADIGSWIQITDEPTWTDPATLQNVLAMMRLVKAASPRVRIFQTRLPEPDLTTCQNSTGPLAPAAKPLLELVDWWCPHVCQWESSAFVRQTLKELAQNKSAMATLYDNGVPVFTLAAARVRTQAWNIFRSRSLMGTLSWYSVNSYQGSLNDTAHSPFLYPNIESKGKVFPAGFGYELYPPPPGAPSEAGWGPIESIRWAMLLAGVQDAEYMYALEKAAPGAPELARVSDVAWAFPVSWRLTSFSLMEDDGYSTNTTLLNEIKTSIAGALERELVSRRH